MTSPNDQLTSIWKEIEQRAIPPKDELFLKETAPLADGKKVLLGKDSDQRLHLCVETVASELGLGDRESKGIEISCRILIQNGLSLPFVDVVCLTPDLAPLFKIVASDMLEGLLRSEAGRFGTCHRTLDRWRALINRPRRPELSPEQLAPIFAELVVLERLTANNPAAIAMWRGPKKVLHDFVCGAIDLEVKSSLKTEARTIEVSALKQLDPPAGGSLFICYFRLNEAPGRGTSVPETIDRILSRGVDSERMYSLLKDAGYDTAHTAAYAKVSFEIVEELLYEVSGAFPRLSAAAFLPGQPPNEVTRISYSLNLQGVPADATSRSEEIFAMASRGVTD